MFSPYEKYDVAKNMKQILSVRGVPKIYLDCNLYRDFPADILHQLSSNVVPLRMDRGYYIFGPCGVGKTHLAAAIMAEQIIRNSQDAYKIADCVRGIYGAWFVSVMGLLNRIKASFSKDAVECEKDILDRVSDYDVLVLDDLGTEKITDWSLQTLYTIIDIRSREGRPMVVTSNLPLDQIAMNLSDRIASRIAGLCKVIEMSGADRRMQE
jgi:DNA replication protein DnaC